MEEQQRLALAKRLKELRRYKGWTEADLWQASGISIQTISRLENAKTTEPRENTLASLAKAFEIGRDELAGPRLTPEQIDDATQTQLDQIEAKLDRVLELLAPGLTGGIFGSGVPDDPPASAGARRRPRPKRPPGQAGGAR